MEVFRNIRYRPAQPKRSHNIGLIGCGGITSHHLNAYQNAGYPVVALCDPILERAEAQRQGYYPQADVYRDYHDLLARADIEVLDIATHPAQRIPIIEAALKAGKQVLSQKPFVLDLADGERLVNLAKDMGVYLAVNQNGRWAPHFSYLRELVKTGFLGEISSLEFSLHFDHNWTLDTPFNDIHHLILYDYAIHWFDLIGTLMGKQAKRVYASVQHSGSQKAKPPLIAQLALYYDDCLVTLAINGDSIYGKSDVTKLVASKGTVISEGPDLNRQKLSIITKDGSYTPSLLGAWFDDGFHGTMAELLCAIEEEREPSHSARDNLRSLELCFAALASADQGRVVVPGQVTALRK